MLSDAILEIAQAMEDEAKDLSKEEPQGRYLSSSLKGFARQLRTAVKSAEGVIIATTPSASPLQNVHPAVMDRMLIEQEKQKIRQNKLAKDQAYEEQSRLVADGPEAGVSYLTESGMPVGAKMKVGLEIYELRSDNMLYHVKPKKESK